MTTLDIPSEKAVLSSMKIPLENLLTQLIFLSSGKDKSGRVLLSINCSLYDASEATQILRTFKQSDLVDMLTYFVSLPSNAARASGITVIIKGADVDEAFTKLIFQAMDEVQRSQPRVFYKTYIIQPEGISMDHLVQPFQDKLPLCLVKDLMAHIDKDNLTAEFGGTREYAHIDWLRYRMQVEPFVSDCYSLSKRLSDTVGVLTNPQLPGDYSNAKSALRVHKDQKTSLLDSLHIEQLVKEGTKLQQRMKTPTDSLKDNTDFFQSSSLVNRLLSQVRSVGERLSQLWQTKDTKLETNLELRQYENECQQVNDWFKHYSEEYFDTNDDLGETKEVSMSLLNDLDDFEKSSKEVLTKAETLINEVPKLKELDYIDGDSIQSISDQLCQQITKFEAALAARRKALEDAIRIHTLTEKAITWCLKAIDMIKRCNPSLESFEQQLSELQAFMASDAEGLTTEEQVELYELSDKVKSVWIKENAVFALTRISETIEKISNYKEFLEKEIKEFKLKSKEIDMAAAAANPSPFSVDSVDSGEVLPTATKTPDIYEEGAGLSLCEDPNNYFAEVTAALEKSQELLDAQIPSSPALHSDKQEIGKKRAFTFPVPDEGIKQTRLVDSFDGCISATRSDETDEPEGEHDSMQSQTDKAKKRKQIMNELVETEEEYVKKLHHVCENYIGEIEMLEGLPGGLVGKKNIIFSNFEKLYTFNRDVFLVDLQQIKHSPMKLGQVFIDHEEEMINYSWYFKNMPAQKELMYEVGAEYFAPVQKRLSDPFPLMENLLLPFQRMTRYGLFLERMIKYSIPTTRGYKELQDALKITNFVVHHGDNLLAVENLHGFSGSIIEQGLLQYQGDLTIIEGRFTSSRRRVFLFESIIIIAKKNKATKGSTETFTYKESYKTNELGLREFISGHPTRFELWDRKKHTILFQADNLDEKNEWARAIHNLFMDQMKRLKEQQEIYQSRPKSVGFARGRSMSVRYRTKRQNPRLSADLSALPIPSIVRPFSQLSNISGSSEDKSHASSHISGPFPIDSRYSAASSSHYELIGPLPQTTNNNTAS